MTPPELELWVQKIEEGIKWDNECGEMIPTTADFAIQFVNAYRAKTPVFKVVT